MVPCTVELLRDEEFQNTLVYRLSGRHGVYARSLAPTDFVPVGYGRRVREERLEGTGVVVAGGLVAPCARGGVWRGGLVTLREIDCTAMDELVEGALPMAAAFREGPDARLPGAVTIFAISRPSSPMRP